MAKEKITYRYDADSHTTTCIRKKHNHIYTGLAICHPDDYQYESERVGQQYAYTRSMIDELRQQIKELRIKRSALKNIKEVFSQSRYDETRNYAPKTVQKQINYINRDIDELKSLITTMEKELEADATNRAMVQRKLAAMRTTNG